MLVKSQRVRNLIVAVTVLALGLAMSSADAQWVAYNDCLRETGDSTTANVTGWTIHNYDLAHFTGSLKNFETGSNEAMPAVTFTMGAQGLQVSSGGAGGNPSPGTDAYEIFHGIIDFGPNNVYYGGSGWWVEIEFTDLDPTKMYALVGTAIRSSNYPGRKSLFTIIGHQSATFPPPVDRNLGIWAHFGLDTETVATNQPLYQLSYAGSMSDDVRFHTMTVQKHQNAYATSWLACPSRAAIRRYVRLIGSQSVAFRRLKPAHF